MIRIASEAAGRAKAANGPGAFSSLLELLRPWRYFGLIIARPARSMIHGWQARRHARTAFGLIDAQQWKEAREETTAAYH